MDKLNADVASDSAADSAADNAADLGKVRALKGERCLSLGETVAMGSRFLCV
jgi:hypothetical protein